MLKKFIISPPFGNYISREWATSVYGTFTLKKRPGLVWQCIKTVRPTSDGWVNKIGFRNKGIKNVEFTRDGIYSVAGLHGDDDWIQICEKVPKRHMVEVNAGCPNVGDYSISPKSIKLFVDKFGDDLILKIAPTKEGMYMVAKAHSLGVSTVHLCNTLPVESGGESGKRLKKFSLAMVEETKTLFPDLRVIGGGGIYTKQDLVDYKNAGADHFSLATIWFTPWRVKKLFD